MLQRASLFQKPKSDSESDDTDWVSRIFTLNLMDMSKAYSFISFYFFFSNRKAPCLEYIYT